MGSKGAIERNKFGDKFKFSYRLNTASRPRLQGETASSFAISTETVSPSAKEIMALTFFVYSCDSYVNEMKKAT